MNTNETRKFVSDTAALAFLATANKDKDAIEALKHLRDSLIAANGVAAAAVRVVDAPRDLPSPGQLAALRGVLVAAGWPVRTQEQHRADSAHTDAAEALKLQHEWLGG